MIKRRSSLLGYGNGAMQKESQSLSPSLGQNTGAIPPRETKRGKTQQAIFGKSVRTEEIAIKKL